MLKETLDFVKVLTQRDTKTLSQKSLKLSAEAGELANAVLPMENASGSMHKLTSRHHILDEVADVMLAALSVAYSLGFSDQEIDDMLRAKMNKWGSLQALEGTIRFPIPFEIHITVGSDVLTHEELLCFFREDCVLHEMKCLDIVPYHATRGYDPFKADVMCSKVVFGTQQEAMTVMTEIVESLLGDKDFKIVRQKIETVPWHPLVKQAEHDNTLIGTEPGVYLESHIEVATPGAEDVIRQSMLEHLGFHNDEDGRYSLFMSRNEAKQNCPLIVTYRHAGVTKAAYDANLKELQDHLRDNLKLDLLKTVTELSIYDTAPDHDEKVYA